MILLRQSSRPVSFSPAGLTLWRNWLERWLATLSGLSAQVRIPVGSGVVGAGTLHFWYVPADRPMPSWLLQWPSAKYAPGPQQPAWWLDCDHSTSLMILDSMPLIKPLTHSGLMHTSTSKLTIIGSDNGLSPRRRQTIIWTNDGILLIWHLGINFSEISIEIHIFSFRKMQLKSSSVKWCPFCLGLNVLNTLPSRDIGKLGTR